MRCWWTARIPAGDLGREWVTCFAITRGQVSLCVHEGSCYVHFGWEKVVLRIGVWDAVWRLYVILVLGWHRVVMNRSKAWSQGDIICELSEHGPRISSNVQRCAYGRIESWNCRVSAHCCQRAKSRFELVLRKYRIVAAENSFGRKKLD